MPANFFDRLGEYLDQVGSVLRGEAAAASIFPNSADIGASREKVYLEFLRQHSPKKCNIFLGGFLFHRDGSESGQLDVIVTTDTAPRYDFYNRDGSGKSFAPVEGTIAVVSIKSTLTRAELFNALEGIASIPPTVALGDRLTPFFLLDRYDDWPLKIVYASNGLSAGTIASHLDEFYEQHPEVPLNRRPDLIHVAGKYAIFRVTPQLGVFSEREQRDVEPIEGSFRPMTRMPDRQAMIWVMTALQERAIAASHILFTYEWIIPPLSRIPR